MKTRQGRGSRGRMIKQGDDYAELMEKYISEAEAANIIGCSVASIRVYKSNGRIPSEIAPNGQRMLFRDAVTAYGQAFMPEDQKPTAVCNNCGEPYQRYKLSAGRGGDPSKKYYRDGGLCVKCGTDKKHAKAGKETDEDERRVTSTYVPHSGGQVEFHESKARYKLLSCVPPGEIIPGAYKPVEEIRVGDRVYGLNGRLNDVYRVLDREYEGNLVTVKARYLSPFSVTDEHPILVTRFVRNDNSYAKAHGNRAKKTEWRRGDSKWVEAKELVALIAENGKYSRWCVQIPRLMAGEAVEEWVFERRLKTRKANDKRSFPITEETAWVLGLYMAEGCSTDGGVIQWALCDDEAPFAERVKNVLDAQGYLVRVNHHPENHVLIVRTCSAQLSDVLREKFGHKAHNKHIPEELMTHPDENIIRAFLRGYFDGDGHIQTDSSHPSGSLRAKTASPVLASQLQLLLARFGYAAIINRSKRHNSTIQGRKVTNRDAFNVCTSDGRFMRWLGFDAPERALQEYAYVHEDAVFVPLQKAELVPYKGPVFNLSTDDETFLIANAVSHNCGNRWGKDRCSVNEFIRQFALMLSEDRGPELIPKVHGFLVAPNFNLTRQLWRELKDFFPAEWVEQIYEGDKIIITKGGGVIEMKSADDPNALVSVGLDIVQVTEAARIANLDEVWAYLYGRVQSPGRGPGGKGGIVLMNSTPKGRNYWGGDLIWRGVKGHDKYDPEFETFIHPASDNPYLRPDELEKARKNLPDRLYRQEWLAEVLDEADSVFRNVRECANYHGTEDPEAGESYVIGWDPAMVADYSAVAVRNSSGQIVTLRRWTGVPWEQQVNNIVGLSHFYNYAPVVVDVTGIGKTLPQTLERKGITVGEDNMVHFTNQVKEDLVNNLAFLMEQKHIAYPADHEHTPALMNELSNFKYFINEKTGTVRYSAPRGNGQYDDLVTAVMLSMKDFTNVSMDTPYFGFLGGAQIGGGKRAMN